MRPSTEHDHRGNETGRGPYARFGAMIATSTAVMLGLTYLNTYSADHVYWSETRAYMALVMGAAMAVVMLTFMLGMHKKKAANIAIYAGSVVVFAGALALVRSQRTVDDVSYMKAMIPHHSIAILTSERAKITDPRVRKLADGIIQTQINEIEQMKRLIEDLEQNAPDKTEHKPDQAIDALTIMPRMKITILASYATLAGGTRVLAEYANRLSARGHDVTVVSLPPKQPTTKARLRALVKERKWLPTRTHGASHFDNGQFDWRILDEHRDIEARDVPDGDVVISSWWMTAECMHRLPKSKGEQVHFVQHHELWEPQHFDRVKAVYAHPSHKITISAWLKETLERDYGHSNVPIVHNAANHDTFDAPPRERNATFTIGLMYSKTKFKGLEVSIAALNQAMPEIGDCRLVSFGTSTPEAPTELPEGSEFHLKPPQNKIAEIYRSCDVWLCGSHAEGFHLPPQEAMACRCPVVSTRVGGPMDIVEDGVNGFVVDTGDSKGLADRLVQVASLDADAWRAMSGGAYATGHGWTWENATDAFERELEKAVAVSV